MENNKAVLGLDQLENVSGGSGHYPTPKTEPKYQLHQPVRYNDMLCTVEDVYHDGISWIYDLMPGFRNVFEDQISPF